jgi:uncharacterized protein YhaN
VKLLELTLARFGHFAGTKLDLGSGTGLFLVHGPNEAGKTTALHAVRALLFGIPQQARQYTRGYDQTELRIDAIIELQGGLRAELSRTKGRKEPLHTRLLSGGGESVDQEWLNDKLGRPNRDLYNQVFAFSLDALAKGADLLSNENVKGVLYGAGFGGTVRPAEILATLEDEKDALFKERGRETKLNRAPRELADLAAKIRGAVRGSEVYEALEREHTTAQSKAQAKEAELATAQAEKERLITLQRALVVFSGQAADVRELRELAVPPRFTPDLARETLRALEDEARWSESLERETAELAALAEERAALPLAPALLAERAVIARLERSLDGQRALREELLVLEATERAEVARCQAELSRLRPGWTLEQLAAASFAEGQLQELQGLLETDRSLVDVTRAARASIEAADDAIAREAAQGATLAAMEMAVEPVERLEAWLVTCRVAEEGAEQTSDAVRAAAALERRERQLLARLRPLPSAPLDTVAPPAADQIEAARVARHQLSTRTGTTLERQRDAEAQLAQTEAALEALEAHDRAPSEAELAQARRGRDAQWEALAKRIAGPPAGDALPSPDELRAFADRVAATDRLADELRWRADAVQKRLRLEEERAAARATVKRWSDELRRQEEERTSAEETWQRSWSAVGITAGTPDAMRTWRDTWEQAVTLISERAAADAKVASLHQREHAVVREGASLLGVDVADPTLTMKTLRAQAEARVQRVRDDARRREEHRRTELERRRERDQAEARLARATRERATWNEAWQRTCAALGLDEPERPLTPVEARAVVAPLVALQKELVGGRAQRTTRRRQIEDGSFAFAEEVSRRIAPLDPAASDAATDPFSQVERVHLALAAAEKTEQKRKTLTDRETALARTRATAAAELERARRTLTLAREAAGTDDDSVLRRLGERAPRAAELAASIDGADRELARLRGEQAAAELVAELAATSPSALETALENVETTLGTLKTEAASLHRESGALDEKRRSFDGGEQAAELRSEQEAVRAKLREAVEAYATAALAHEILQRNIKRFERENKPQLLARTEQLFRIMTDGAFVGVTQDIDRSLVVERPDGRKNTPDELSTGTAEQLFLALRLAYIETYEARGVEPLPVVLDDVLVNFDDARALCTLRALAVFAQRNQLLFFTCHAHLVELSQKANLGLPVLELSARPLGSAAQPAPPALAPLLLEPPTEAPTRRRKKSSG